jgi:acyl carrier protein
MKTAPGNLETSHLDEATVTAAILSAIRDYNLQVPPDRRIPETAEAPLFGRHGRLDSLGLVNLIVLVEEQFQDAHHVALTLADERAVSQERSPFRSVPSLTAYICLLLNEGNHG